MNTQVLTPYKKFLAEGGPKLMKKEHAILIYSNKKPWVWLAGGYFPRCLGCIYGLWCISRQISPVAGN